MNAAVDVEELVNWDIHCIVWTNWTEVNHRHLQKHVFSVYFANIWMYLDAKYRKWRITFLWLYYDKKKKKKNALAIDLKRRHLQTFWFYVFVSGFDSCFAIVLQDSGGTLVILYLTLRASVLSLPLINWLQAQAFPVKLRFWKIIISTKGILLI